MAQGVRVELELGGSTGWIESEEVDALVAPLATAAQRKLPTDLLCSDEAACAQRCAKAFLAVKVGPLAFSQALLLHNQLPQSTECHGTPDMIGLL